MTTFVMGEACAEREPSACSPERETGWTATPVMTSVDKKDDGYDEGERENLREHHAARGVSGGFQRYTIRRRSGVTGGGVGVAPQR